MSDKLKKNEVSKMLGINRSTIRYYEQVGLIKPEVDDNNYREYGIEELKVLSQINFLREINLNIETIDQILNDQLNNRYDVLIQKKNELNDLIKQHKDNIKKIDEILKYNISISESVNNKILHLNERYLYKLNSPDGSLDKFYKKNEGFFQSNFVRIGSWFVNTLEAQSFLNEGCIDFVEYIQVNDNIYKEIITIPRGRYICFDIVFGNENTEDWVMIVNNIKEVLLKNALKVRDCEVLFLNKDNLNFNFNESKRTLSIEVPIE